MRTSVQALVGKGNIFAFVYGEEGVGKTRLALSLAPGGKGLGVITPEAGGPLALASAGAGAVPVDLIELNGQDPVEQVLKALRAMGNDPSINTVLLDGMTVLSGHIISHITGGGTEKQMGFDGWGQMLGGLRAVSFACEQLKKQGKNLVMTAWEAPPEYEDTMAGQQLKASGRPYLLGKAKFWLPGGCDIVARMTSKMVNAKGPDGKLTKTWKGELHFDRDGIWLAKSRWPLPSPFPADFAKLLASVKGAAASMSSATPVAKPGVKPVPPTSSKPKG